MDWFTPNMKPQIIMMVVYAGLNIWGLIEWSKGTNVLNPQWETKENIKCVDCGNISRGFRLVKTTNYDKSNGVIEFRCQTCSNIKIEKLKDSGVIL